MKATRTIRRGALSVINVLLHHRLLYRLIGKLNRRYNFLASVFVAYPASAEYAAHYFSTHSYEKARWNPILCALIVQDGKLTLGLGITATETEIRKRGNEQDLAALRDIAERIADDLGAPNVTYSGILPGLMLRRQVIDHAIEAEVTAAVVDAAIGQVVDGLRWHDTAEVPIIVLGGRGFVGAALCDRLASRTIYQLDMGDPWPDELRGHPALLVNVANRRALRQHIGDLWPELVLLNEVYPEPTPKELADLKDIGVKAFHVVGVEARCFPPMPKAYRGGIPCCAAWTADTMTPLITELV